jgi:LacI family transcriptional regulator
MMMKVTIRDIALDVGVSQSTVSRALSGHPAISEDTRTRVRESARRLDYRDRTPPRPASGSRMIGVVVAALQNQFYMHLLDKLHAELRDYGYHMTLIVDSMAQKEDFSAFETLFSDYLDGIILTTASTDSRWVGALEALGIPIVLAVRAIDGLPFDTVEVDNYAAGREAARHLFSLGHRRIAFLMGPAETSTSRDRHRGGISWLMEHDVSTPDELVHWTQFNHESGYSGLLRLMNQPSPPTAVICGNDVIALGALEAARKYGIEVPGTLSIIGFDDMPIAGWEMVRLTTIRQPIDEMARLTAQRMVERLRDKSDNAPRHDVLPVSLVQRNTTAISKSG